MRRVLAHPFLVAVGAAARGGGTNALGCSCLRSVPALDHGIPAYELAVRTAARRAEIRPVEVLEAGHDAAHPWRGSRPRTAHRSVPVASRDGRGSRPAPACGRATDPEPFERFARLGIGRGLDAPRGIGTRRACLAGIASLGVLGAALGAAHDCTAGAVFRWQADSIAAVTSIS